MTKVIFGAALLLMCTGATLATQEVAEGKKVFAHRCVACHGKDGTRGAFGAANLQVSMLGDTDLYATISNGRGNMPAWKNKLSPEEITAVVRYIKTLRTRE